MPKPCSRSPLLPLCLSLVAPGLSHAQQASLVLEEVIVTAQKREQTLQDVPISVLAFNSERLQAMGIDFVDILHLCFLRRFIRGRRSGLHHRLVR